MVRFLDKEKNNQKPISCDQTSDLLLYIVLIKMSTVCSSRIAYITNSHFRPVFLKAWMKKYLLCAVCGHFFRLLFLEDGRKSNFLSRFWLLYNRRWFIFFIFKKTQNITLISSSFYVHCPLFRLIRCFYVSLTSFFVLSRKFRAKSNLFFSGKGSVSMVFS